jgi:prepilin-type N-terminal cleavage/methylation domain-containing protein
LFSATNNKMKGPIIHKTPHRYGKGFTLVEVMMVLVILGIAATIVVPMVSDTSDMKATSAARQITSTLLYAQTASISSQQQYQVVFDTTNNSYEVQDSAGNVILDPVVGSPYQIQYPNDRRTDDVLLETANFDGTNTIWFDRLGAPYGGAISDSPPPLSSGQVTVRVKDKSITINVEPVTGRITIQ